MAGASYRCQTKHQNGEENDLIIIVGSGRLTGLRVLLFWCNGVGDFFFIFLA